MASTAVSGTFEPRSGVSHQQHSSITSVHLAGRQSLSSSYSSTSMPTTTPQPVAPFEGIVDFSYNQPHFAPYNPSSSDPSVHHHHATSASAVDGSEWKQSSFFSYRPNEVKHRKRTTRQQLKVLEETFRSTQKPDGNVRKSLALQLNMTPRNVQVWFQNRRAKDKTLAKRALRNVEEVGLQESGKPASPAGLDSEPVASPRSEQDFRARYGPSAETHSGSVSPIESVFPTLYEVPTPVYVANDLAASHIVSPSSSAYSQSDLGQVQPSAYRASSSFGSETSAGTQFPAAYARDMYAPRASLPHIHATAFQQDSQHQRSSSSPTFPCNVDSTSNLSLTTYASVNGVLYPQQRQFSQPMYAAAQRNPVGPLPSADFSFGMNGDAEAEELTGYASYSQFGSVSGSDTPSSVGGLSRYSSVASLAESARSFDEDGAPFNWKNEQRRGSIPLGVRPSFAGLAGRGFSPLSVGYSSNSPCPGAESAEPESDGADNTNYMTSRSLKMEGIDSNQVLGYPQGAFGFNGGVDHDTRTAEAYQQYLAYGQQQTVSDNMLNYSYTSVQPDMSELQMPRPTANYGGYRFA